MRWPERFQGGRRVASLVQIQDLAATVLAAAGLDPDEIRAKAPEAENLLPLATGEKQRVRDWAACVYRNTGIKEGGVYFDPEIHATMFMDERFKLGVYHDVNGSPGAETEGVLYDMQEDPDELHNLWADPAYRDVRLRLTERMLDWQVAQELRYGRRGSDLQPAASQRIIQDPTRDK